MVKSIELDKLPKNKYAKAKLIGIDTNNLQNIALVKASLDPTCLLKNPPIQKDLLLWHKVLY